jgi:polyisoprenoid-binding protein YceI
MKKTLFYVAGIAALSMLASCGGNSQQSENADSAAQAGENAGTYAVDAANSSLEWRGSKIIAASEHKGTIGIKEGSLSVEGGKVVAGSFVIDMNSIKNTDLTDTGYQKKLVGHLMAEDFFNVAKFPTGKFEIVSVEEKASEGNTHEVSGNLTLRDSTRKITFPATIKVEGNTVTATGKATINRFEWGITYDKNNLNLFEKGKRDFEQGVVNKEMEISISLKANR